MNAMKQDTLDQIVRLVAGFTGLPDAEQLGRTFAGLLDHANTDTALEFVELLGTQPERTRNMVFLRVLSAGQSALATGATVPDVEAVVDAADEQATRELTETWSGRLFPLPETAGEIAAALTTTEAVAEVG